MTKYLIKLAFLLGLTYPSLMTGMALDVSNKPSQNAADKILVYTQTKGSPSPLEAKGLEFTKVPRGVLRATNGEKAYWLKFNAYNGSNQNMKRSIDFKDATFTDLILFEDSPEGFKEIYHAGRKYPESVKNFEINFSKEINFTPKETKSFLIRVTNNITATTDIYINDTTHKKRQDAEFFFLVFGSQFFMLALGFYSVFLWARLRVAVYGYYSLFVISFVFLTTTNQGLNDALLYPLTGLIIYDFTPATFYLAGIFAALYTSSFLNLKSQDKPLYFLINIALIANIVGFIGVFIGISDPFVRDSLNAFSSVIFVTASIRSINRGFKPAKVFFIGYGCFCLGVLFYIAAGAGLIERNYFTKYGGVWGGMVEVIIMSIALADRIKLQQEQKVTLDEQKASNQTLHKMIQVLCHDIANPLTVINSHAKLRSDKSSDELDRKAFKKIAQSAEDINDIILDVRAIESSKTGKLKLNLEPVCLEQAVKQCIETFRDRIDNKSIDIVIVASTESDAFVIASPSALKNSVINNVLSNAIKFTPKGGNISITIAKQNEESIALTIKDSGIGIPPEVLENLFDSTRNMSRLGTNNEAGTGFGMPVMRAYMEAFKGKVEVTSTHLSDEIAQSGTAFKLVFQKAQNKGA